MTDLSNLSKTAPINPWQLNGIIMNQRVSNIKSTQSNETDALKRKAVCKEFESLFLNYLLKEMRATIPKSGFLDGGQAEQIYTAMYDERIAQEMADRGGIGLAEIIEKSLLKDQDNDLIP
ncbi:MAG: rod-binding protein [Desulfobacteraceae bacterium]|jgi:flagellar protein FlgJ